MASAFELRERDRAVMVFDGTLLSDSSGDATFSLPPVSGKIVQIITDPDGSAAPTDNWDLTAVGSDAIRDGAVVSDYFNGAALNRDTANVEFITEADLGLWVGFNETLVITGANMGNAKQAVVRIFVLRIS